MVTRYIASESSCDIDVVFRNRCSWLFPRHTLILYCKLVSLKNVIELADLKFLRISVRLTSPLLTFAQDVKTQPSPVTASQKIPRTLLTKNHYF